MKGRRATTPSFANPPGAIERFDYSAPAELFMSRVKGKGPSSSYRRFETAAEAIQFALEALPASILIGSVLEVREDRFDHHAIRELYDGSGYPLPRM